MRGLVCGCDAVQSRVNGMDNQSISNDIRETRTIKLLH